MTPGERIEQLAILIREFEATTALMEGEIFALLQSKLPKLLANPGSVAETFATLDATVVGWIDSLVAGLLEVQAINELYFLEMDIAKLSIASGSNSLFSSIGVSRRGVIVKDGYLYQLAKDSALKREIIDAVTIGRVKKLTTEELGATLQTLVVGNRALPGGLDRLVSKLVAQPHVQADRVLQYAIAQDAGLKAGIYTGGLIDSSRPFCIVRNGKCFTDWEWSRFGTSKDAYGGYTDKREGKFAGKPKSDYDPDLHCGGIRCRHTKSAVTNAEALRRRSDLKEVNGELVLI